MSLDSRFPTSFLGAFPGSYDGAFTTPPLAAYTTTKNTPQCSDTQRAPEKRDRSRERVEDIDSEDDTKKFRKKGDVRGRRSLRCI